MCHNEYYENGHKGICSMKKTWDKKFITIGIGEKYGAAEVSTTKKNNRILG